MRSTWGVALGGEGGNDVSNRRRSPICPWRQQTAQLRVVRAWEKILFLVMCECGSVESRKGSSVWVVGAQRVPCL